MDNIIPKVCSLSLNDDIPPDGQAVFRVDEINRLVDDLKNLLECSICRERYTKPEMLPCQHAFCSVCLKKLTKRLNWNCPICRKYFPPHTSKSCLILNKLIEIASHHQFLSVPRESSPPPEEDSIDGNYELAFSLDLSEYPSSSQGYSDFEYASEMGDTDESISSYMTRNRILNYDDLFVDLHDISNESDDFMIQSSPVPNSPSHHPISTQTNHRRHLNINTNNTNSRNRGDSRIFRRCPYWPQCIDDENCNYTHPKRKCRNNPCRFGRNCCFLHQRDMTSFRRIHR